MTNHAIEAIRAEAEALAALADKVEAGWQALGLLIEAIEDLPGRVICSGIGKSAINAHRLAAMLCATGQPAQFVHAADAGHGDLGALSSADMLIIFSRSGASIELGPIADRANSLGIALALITAKPESALAQISDIVLAIPDLPEASHLRVPIPTVSSAMMAALGDAIVVDLMERRAFDTDDFCLVHPAGELGKIAGESSDD